MNAAYRIGNIFIYGNLRDFPAFVKCHFQIRLIRATVAVEQAECPLILQNLSANPQVSGQLADVLEIAAKTAAVFLKICRRCFYAEMARYPGRLVRALDCSLTC